MTTTSSAAPPGREAAPGASGGPRRSGRSGPAADTGGPRAAVEAATARLAASGDGAPGPYLIGVRHHAPSLSAVVPALLDAVRPEVVLVELPAEFQPWLGWLADDSTRAPVALAAAPGGAEGGGAEGSAGAGASGLAFYPFADFSPELAALRWARRNGVEVVACDLPLAHRAELRRADADRAGTDRAGTDRAGGSPAAGAPAAGAPVDGRGPGFAGALRRRLTGRDGDEDLWDRLVETAAPGSTPEAVRRAALLVGWAMRRDAEEGPGVDPYDLRREAWMRARIAAAASGGRRVAAVVGAFHAPALLHGAERPDGPQPSEPAGSDGCAEARTAVEAVEGPARPSAGEPQAGGHVVSLIPYTYPLLDARSGYPAGIRDPEWQHTVLEAGGDRDRLAEALVRTAVRICEALRTQDHPAGPADAREIVRLAGDLARLRGLSAPGRGELVEAVQTVLAQGEPLGRGRAVARALERVLVGNRTGRAAPAAPRSGLAPAVEALLAELGLPGPADAAESASRDLRLDPLRSPLDRRRELLLHRLTACGVPYGEPVAGTAAGGIETVGTRWQVQWTPATAAMLTVAGTRGVTPAQAAEGALRERLRREQQTDGPTGRDVLQGLADAAACGLPALAGVRLDQLTSVLPESGTLPELLDGLALLDRLIAGHVPGLPVAAGLPPADRPVHDEGRAAPAAAVAGDRATAAGPEATGRAAAAAAELLTVAAVRQLEGLGGSDDPADARALLELARRADRSGGLRLGHVLAELTNDGSPLVRGAAGSVRVLLGHDGASALGGRAASWIDGATDPAARHALARSLVGMLTAAEGLFATAPEVLEPVLERVTALADTAFLDRLPALRGGFDTLSPAARDRLLTLVEERLGTRVQALPDTVAPALFARWARADLAARTALGRRGLLPAETTGPQAGRPKPTAPPAAPGGGTVTPAATTGAATAAPDAAATAHALTPAERWRLLLGRPGSGGLGGRSARLATALDELYGTGHGEGSGPGLDGRGGAGGHRGGRGAPYPGVREWSEELVALFGPGIREEVLAAAVAHGRTDALDAVDPDAVRPSVDLLRTVLEHAGGLPEARIAMLRPLVRRLVDELTRELATRLRPALTGVGVPRPSRRPGGGLDLDRTIRANLATARPAPSGPEGERGTLIVPERPVFRTRARKAADWRLILVVDVSGSMEASTVWAALTASILAGVPSLSTHFVAFSTEVVDLTEQVRDPLGLLLEVRIGGGTSIATGLEYAQELVTVPSRTLVAVISDFEEGGPVGALLARTRALVDSGCHVLGCAALDDTGKARYSKAVASRLVAAGMPVAALSPLELARWVGEKVR
ncbi:DUF5682 family protein [Kitasatospora hibisci]|uniref:DUF5682 family protein n=1 Tax=Kitasatospora hibisci TaxID=3369522 RepID=UPI003753F321